MATEKISSILRALSILECFTDTDTELTLKQLVDKLDLPQTTVFRQVSTLRDRAYLVQDPFRKTYKVGPQLLMLASRILGTSDIRTICRPEIEHLSTIVKETINLTALNGFNIFYLDKVETFRSIVCKTRIGTSAYAHATSGGKIFLAFQSQEFQEEYYAMMPTFKPYTENTIRTVDKLQAELLKIRREGFSIDYAEIEDDLICVGAPVFDLNGKVIVTVSAAGPKYRMQENLDFMKSSVILTASKISRLFGYRNHL